MPQAGVEVVLPDRRVPVGRAALEHLAAPDVVDEHVEAAVVPSIRSASAATWAGSRWSTGTAMPVPPSSVTSAAVSSMVSGRS